MGVVEGRGRCVPRTCGRYLVPGVLVAVLTLPHSLRRRRRLRRDMFGLPTYSRLAEVYTLKLEVRLVAVQSSTCKLRLHLYCTIAN